MLPVWPNKRDNKRLFRDRSNVIQSKIIQGTIGCTPNSVPICTPGIYWISHRGTLGSGYIPANPLNDAIRSELTAFQHLYGGESLAKALLQAMAHKLVCKLLGNRI